MPNREMVNSYYVMDFYIDIKKNGDLKMVTVWTAVKSMVAKVTQESEAQQSLVQCLPMPAWAIGLFQGQPGKQRAQA